MKSTYICGKKKKNLLLENWKGTCGSSLMAWWLQFWAFIAVAQVQFLVRELRSYKPHSVVKKKKLEGNLWLIKECLVSPILFKGNKAGIIYIKCEIVIAYVENSKESTNKLL